MARQAPRQRAARFESGDFKLISSPSQRVVTVMLVTVLQAQALPGPVGLRIGAWDPSRPGPGPGRSRSESAGLGESTGRARATMTGGNGPPPSGPAGRD
jgi:hypothetical protein